MGAWGVRAWGVGLGGGSMGGGAGGWGWGVGAWGVGLGGGSMGGGSRGGGGCCDTLNLWKLINTLHVSTFSHGSEQRFSMHITALIAITINIVKGISSLRTPLVNCTACFKEVCIHRYTGALPVWPRSEL